MRLENGASCFPSFRLWNVDSKNSVSFLRVVLGQERSSSPAFSITDSKTMQRSALCRSRRELSNESLLLNLLFEPDSYSNEYLIVNFGFDTAENEPCKVCPLTAYGSPRFAEVFSKCGRRLLVLRKRAQLGRLRLAETRKT